MQPISYQRFEKTYGSQKSVRNYYYTLSNIPEGRRFHILRSGSLKSRLVHLYGEATLRHGWRLERLRMGAVGCPETSAGNYHCTLRNIPEEHRLHLLRLKSKFG
jgi:hypothetical protein